MRNLGFKRKKDIVKESYKFFDKSPKKKKLSRQEYIYNFFSFNKAFLWNKGRTKENLRILKDRYKKYRKNWHLIPKESFINKRGSKELKRLNLPPQCIDIETAAVCDLACPFCFRDYIATPDKIISKELCYSIIDQAARLGVPSIKFNWRGEPLLHPNLPDFISYAKKKGILETLINTNATNLSEKKSMELIDSGFDVLIYSFDGGTKETYEKMRPGRFKKNKFEHVYSNIVNFKKIREKKRSFLPFTKVQMVVNNKNIKEQKKFFSLFKDCVDEVGVTVYQERGGEINKLPEKIRKKIIKYENSTKKKAHYIIDSNNNYKLSIGRKPCEQPFQRLMITYDGRVGMCCVDWGATYCVGYVDELAIKKDLKENLNVIDNVKKNKEGYELLICQLT